MRPMRAIALALAAGAVLAACGKSSPDESATQTSSAPNQADVTFAQGMIPHHQQAIDMAELVADRTSRPELHSLAGDIQRSQGQEIATMQGWLRAWGKPADDGMPGMDHDQSAMPGMMSQDEMTKLQGLRGTSFDLAFVQAMRTHHEGAIKMANDELSQGSLPEVKALARQVIDAQQREIGQLRQWATAWSKATP
jgi:uncharacterized protein (DUF305 family)